MTVHRLIWGLWTQTGIRPAIIVSIAQQREPFIAISTAWKMANRKKGKKRQLREEDIADITESMDIPEIVSPLVKDGLSDLTKLVKDIKNSVGQSILKMNEQNEDMKKLKACTEQRDNTIKAVEDNLNTVSTNITSMEQQINDLEQYCRNSSIRIYGYPGTDGADMTEAVLQLIKRIYVNLQSSEIIIAHPLPSSSSKSLLYVTFQHKRSFQWHYNTIKTL